MDGDGALFQVLSDPERDRLSVHYAQRLKSPSIVYRTG